ncbi:hypothetical protein RYX36_006467 [Vicia faba]
MFIFYSHRQRFFSFSDKPNSPSLSYGPSSSFSSSTMPTIPLLQNSSSQNRIQRVATQFLPIRRQFSRHIRLISPNHRLKNSEHTDQGDYSRLAESMAEFIEAKTKLFVGTIH